MMKKFVTVILVTLLAAAAGRGQKHQGFAHGQSEASGYEWPADSAVLENLDRWRDMKFGVLFHYGLYSVPGIVESWSICSEDVDWINRPNDLPYDEYKQWYWNFRDSIAPVNLDAEEWAHIMADAGMRYMIFTTKHHDGFCNFDSRLTDFTIARSPYGKDIVKPIFEAFRNRGFGIGAYFSKPDWHCQWFWNDAYATPNRHINYRRDRHPQWWKNYQDFTAGQLYELLNTDYGRIDILWLDGGWISGDDVGLDTILAEVRAEAQPGLIAVDRTIRGRNENYQTPERGIPAIQLDYPWESCIPLSNDWGWVPDAPYKSPQRVIAMLAETTAKGGSLLLGIGPTADGRIEEPVKEILAEVGRWLQQNGEAIYNTRNAEKYSDGDGLWFTASKSGDYLYAIYAPADSDSAPRTITWRGNLPVGPMTLLADGREVKYKVGGDGSVTVTLHKGLKESQFALKFKTREHTPVYKDSVAPTHHRVADLLKRMTLDEKAAQLVCRMGWEMVQRLPDGSVTVTEEFRQQKPVGAYWATLRADPWTQRTLSNGLWPRQCVEALNAMQRFAVDSTRLGIPLLFAEEAPHGLMAIGATTMPTGLAMASTWNPDLISRAGKAVGNEVAAAGATVAYGPVIDVARDPRWSRMEETFGEDPFLTAELGTAYMTGLQSADAVAGRRVYSTLKHFAAYGVSEAGLNGAVANVGPNQLMEELLPPFERAVKAGAGSIMTSYNAIDGVPSTVNGELIGGLLRRQWGFEGVVFSDLFSIDGLVGVTAKDRAEAGAQALRAGVDLDLGGACYGNRLVEAVNSGLVTEAEVDSAVARVLTMKFNAGLFEHPYVDPKIAERTIGKSHNLAREVATEAAVLLKNDGILPLSHEIKHIAVIGPNAHNIYNQLGDYTAPQPEGKVTTLCEGLRKLAAAGVEVTYVKGCAVRDTTLSAIDAAVKAAAEADVAVVVLGGSSARDFDTEFAHTGAASVKNAMISDMDCGEGFDRATLNLLGDQNRLLEAVIATGTPVVAVYVQGRPLDMSIASERANALLTMWYPGEGGGEALADILYGHSDPSGRLPVSIPRSVGQLPCYYSQARNHDYVEIPSSPLYGFGYGLSYTTFAYSEPISSTMPDGSVKIDVDVTNAGSRRGSEVVQLYQRRGKQNFLKGFRKVSLEPGETANITFSIDPTIAQKSSDFFIAQ